MESRPPVPRSDRTAYDDVQGAVGRTKDGEGAGDGGNATKGDASVKKETNQFEGV
jgi:hypothetical protein